MEIEPIRFQPIREGDPALGMLNEYDRLGLEEDYGINRMQMLHEAFETEVATLDGGELGYLRWITDRQRATRGSWMVTIVAEQNLRRG